MKQIKRPLIGMFLAFVLGELLAYGRIGVVWLLKIGVMFGVVILLLWIFHRKNLSNVISGQLLRVIKKLRILPIFLLAGYSLFVHFPNQYALDGEFNLYQVNRLFVSLKAEVKYIEKRAENYLVEIEVESLQYGNEIMDHSLGSFIYYADAPLQVKIGNQLKLEGWVSPFNQATNPGQFDLRSYYRALGISYQFSPTKTTLVNNRKDELKDLLYQLRNRFSESLSQIFNQEDAGTLKALLLGLKSELDPQIKEMYQASGMAHLLSVSGLHISLIGMGLFRILKKKLGWSYWCSCLLSALITGLFCLMLGGNMTSIRAFVMFSVMLIGQYSGRRYDMVSALCLSGIILLTRFPYQLFQAGFQLSFFAVAGIGLLLPQLTIFVRPKKAWEKAILSAAAVQLSTLPVLVWHMYTYPIYGIFINLIAIPLLSYVFISSATAMFVGLFCNNLARFLAGTSHSILALYDKLGTGSLQLSQAIQLTGRPVTAVFILVCLAFALSLFLLRKKNQQTLQYCTSTFSLPPLKKTQRMIKIVGILSFILLMCLSFSLHRGPQFLITFIDVGQGDGIFLRSEEGESILIDAGSTSVKAMTQNRLEPFLQYYQVNKLDYVLLTHLDEDHISGIRELLEHGFPIDNLIFPIVLLNEEADACYQQLLTLAEQADCQVQYIKPGDVLLSGKLALTCLYPQAENNADDKNENSLVLLAEYQNLRIWLTGDITSPGEEKLIKYLSNKQPAWIQNYEKDSDQYITILKVAHHGSNTSSCPAFLNLIEPDLAVISCGQNNLYGHPHEEVLKRLSTHINTDNIYRTDNGGAVTIMFKNKKWSISSFCSQ